MVNLPTSFGISVFFVGRGRHITPKIGLHLMGGVCFGQPLIFHSINFIPNRSFA